MLKVFISISFLFFSVYGLGQNNSSEMVLPKNYEEYSKTKAKPAKIEVSQSLYLIDEKVLASYFTNNEIPISFPTFTQGMSKESYKDEVLDWLNEDNNMASLSSVGKNKLANSKK